MKKQINAVVAIAARDITKLLRDRARLAASFVFPMIFIGALGTSLQANLGDDLGYNFLTFVFTGVIAQTMFQSTAAGIISLIEDRQNDFAQEMFIAPIYRYSIVLGKILGEMLVSFVQVLGVLVFGLIIGVPMSLASLVWALPFLVLVSLLGGAFGLLVMANIGEQRAANQVFPFLLFPQFFLAGVFNPIKELPLPLLVLSRIAPMTYGVDLFRSVYYQGSGEAEATVLFGLPVNLVVVAMATLVMMVVGTKMFIEKEKNR